MSSTPADDGTPDEQLLAGVAAGDQQAFAALFRRRHTAVYRFALHMTIPRARV
jgi:DNA-directed RNA polymerase specialized sigma24 family protein